MVFGVGKIHVQTPTVYRLPQVKNPNSFHLSLQKTWYTIGANQKKTDLGFFCGIVASYVGIIWYTTSISYKVSAICGWFFHCLPKVCHVFPPRDPRLTCLLRLRASGLNYAPPVPAAASQHSVAAARPQVPIFWGFPKWNRSRGATYIGGFLK